MTMKTVKRMDAVARRCSDCEYGKLIKTKIGVYGLPYQYYRCYAKSTRGRDCGSLRYSCPIGKPLDIDGS